MVSWRRAILFIRDRNCYEIDLLTNGNIFTRFRFIFFLLQTTGFLSFSVCVCMTFPSNLTYEHRKLTQKSVHYNILERIKFNMLLRFQSVCLCNFSRYGSTSFFRCSITTNGLDLLKSGRLNSCLLHTRMQNVFIFHIFDHLKCSHFCIRVIIM